MDNIPMTKQQQCGNVDEELVDRDPPIGNMLRSVINYWMSDCLISPRWENGFLPPARKNK